MGSREMGLGVAPLLKGTSYPWAPLSDQSQPLISPLLTSWVFILFVYFPYGDHKTKLDPEAYYYIISFFFFFFNASQIHTNKIGKTNGIFI